MFKSSQLGGPSSTDPPHPSFLPNYLHPSVRPKLVHVQAGAIPRHYKLTYFVYRNTQYRLICCYRFLCQLRQIPPLIPPGQIVVFYILIAL